MRNAGIQGIATAVALCATSVCLGAGLEYPDNGTRALSRGGAFTVLSDDLSAIAHNPSGLLKGRGTRFLYNHNLSWASLSFDRQPLSTDPTGISVLQNPSSQSAGVFPLGITMALGSDFGLEDWSFAIGVYGPSAVGNLEFSRDGAQRYLLTELDTALVFYTASVAYGERDHWGVGISLQYAHAPWVRFGLMVDGAPNNQPGVNPYTSPFDVHAKLDMSDSFAFTAIVGGWWRIIPELEVGVTSRVIPVFLNLDGSAKLEPVGEAVATREIETVGTGASMDLTLPAYVRAGVRYRHLAADNPNQEVFDAELNVVWENWSTLDSYDLDLRGRAVITGIFDTELPDLAIPKKWRDTISVRLGGTWNVLPELLAVSLGGFWEQGAVPKNYEHIDFPSFNRFGVSTGLRFQFSGFDINVAYLHVFQEDRNVDERTAKVFQIRPVTECASEPSACGGSPTGVPVNAGKFESGWDVLSLGVELHFDQWFRDDESTPEPQRL
jgi:long-subunit fatty acid transport protein